MKMNGLKRIIALGLAVAIGLCVIPEKEVECRRYDWENDPGIIYMNGIPIQYSGYTNKKQWLRTADAYVEHFLYCFSDNYGVPMDESMMMLEIRTGKSGMIYYEKSNGSKTIGTTTTLRSTEQTNDAIDLVLSNGILYDQMPELKAAGFLRQDYVYDVNVPIVHNHNVTRVIDDYAHEVAAGRAQTGTYSYYGTYATPQEFVVREVCDVKSDYSVASTSVLQNIPVGTHVFAMLDTSNGFYGITQDGINVFGYVKAAFVTPVEFAGAYGLQ